MHEHVVVHINLAPHVLCRQCSKNAAGFIHGITVLSKAWQFLSRLQRADSLSADCPARPLACCPSGVHGKRSLHALRTVVRDTTTFS